MPSSSSLLLLRRPTTSPLTPISSPLIQLPLRQKSSWMPRSQYAKVTDLDKLHRRQKALLQSEKQLSFTRANALESLLSHQSHQSYQSTGQPLHSIPIPFSISRTRTNNLPIYEHVRAGGSKHITEVRKLSGDLSALQENLRSVLGLERFRTDNKGRKKENVVVNGLTGNIVVKGWRRAEIVKWAEIMGF